MQSYRKLALLLLLAGEAGAQVVSPVLVWTPPTQNTDNSPLTDLAGYVIYHGISPTSFPDSRVLSNSSRPTSYRWEDLPANRTHYFVISSLNTANQESIWSNVASTGAAPPPLLPPGPVINLRVEPVSANPILVTISAINGVNEANLAIAGDGPVTITLLGSLVFDWARPGASWDILTPTIPPLGGNGGANAKSVTFMAPVTTRIDMDPTAPFGGTVTTINGITKPFINSSGTWTVSFP